jgi:hypothetical protein
VVTVSTVSQYPQSVADDTKVVPLDVGRWAVLEGGTQAQRRRIASELRALARRLPVRLAAA